jgi:hypothetical protein
MKFGQTLKAVATSLGMFAAGSWIVPCFSLTSVTQIASAVPMSENSNDDTWSGSDVARAWASATGSEYDPASQVLVMQSGEDHVPVVLDQVRSEDGRSVGLSYFMVDLSLPIAEASQQDEEFGVTTGAEFVTGRILGALDHPGYFSGVRFSMLAESGLSSNAPEQFAFLPIIAFQSEAHAATFHAKMMKASRGDEGDEGGEGGEGGGITCINPDWRGFNGVECCMLKRSYDNRVSACEAEWMARLVACILAAVGVGVGAAWKLGKTWCPSACRGPTPQACFVCVAGVIVVGFGAAIGTMILCQLGNDALRSGCLHTALATYQENLANAGCPAKPLPFGHSASDPTDPNELSAAPNNAHILRSEVDE